MYQQSSNIDKSTYIADTENGIVCITVKQAFLNNIY